MRPCMEARAILPSKEKGRGPTLSGVGQLHPHLIIVLISEEPRGAAQGSQGLPAPSCQRESHVLAQGL